MFTVIRLKAGTLHASESKRSNSVGFFVADSGTMLSITRSEAAHIVSRARKFAAEYPNTHQKPTRTVYYY